MVRFLWGQEEINQATSNSDGGRLESGGTPYPPPVYLA